MKYQTKSEFINLLSTLHIHHDAKVFLQVSSEVCDKFLGGSQTIIDAFMEFINEDGAIIVPTFTLSNLDCASSQDIAYEDWTEFRKEAMGFRKDVSETNRFGNQFLRNKKVVRNTHPIYSYAVYGNVDCCSLKPSVNFPLSLENDLGFFEAKESVNLLIDVDMEKSVLLQGLAKQKNMGRVCLARARMYRKNGSTSRVFLQRKLSSKDILSQVKECNCENLSWNGTQIQKISQKSN